MDDRRWTMDYERGPFRGSIVHRPSSIVVRLLSIVLRLSSILLCGALALSARSALGGEETMPGLDLSTKKDALRAIDQGLQWLKARQNADGSWGKPPRLELTAFATGAILRDPARERGKLDAGAAKGLEFIASCAQKGSGIYRDLKQPLGNTVASMLALAASHQERYEPLILDARRFIVRGQDRRENSGQFGGWAKGDSPADVKMTALAIEALSATQRTATADADRHISASADPDWAAAVAFLSHCQNLADKRPQDLGGFCSKPDAKEAARRSEGLATALGLTALLESNVGRRDPRVLAAVDWLRANYTLDEEAGGLGKQRLFFYHRSLADALNLYGEEPLLRPGKPAADWRRELMIKLMSLQRTDEKGLGFWVNEQGDDDEKDPVFATAFCILALETLVDEPPY